MKENLFLPLSHLSFLKISISAFLLKTERGKKHIYTVSSYNVRGYFIAGREKNNLKYNRHASSS